MTRSRAFWASVIGWVLTGWLLAFFDRPIWDALWIGAVYLWGCYAVAGLLLLGQFSAPPEIVRLFGGDLVTCRPVVDHYFRCWFT